MSRFPMSQYPKPTAEPLANVLAGSLTTKHIDMVKRLYLKNKKKFLFFVGGSRGHSAISTGESEESDGDQERVTVSSEVSEEFNHGDLGLTDLRVEPLEIVVEQPGTDLSAALVPAAVYYQDSNRYCALNSIANACIWAGCPLSPTQYQELHCAEVEEASLTIVSHTSS